MSNLDFGIVAMKELLTADVQDQDNGFYDFLALKHKAEAEALERAEWVLEVKGDHTKGDIEVSAVIKGIHGHTSWGWSDPKTKIIVLSCSSTSSCCDYIDPRIIETAKAIALEIVNKKNVEKTEMKKDLNKLTMPAKDYVSATFAPKQNVKSDIRPKGVVLRKSTKTPEQVAAEVSEAMGINNIPNSKFINNLLGLIEQAGLECVVSHHTLATFTERAGFDLETKDAAIFAFGCLLADEFNYPSQVDKIDLSYTWREYGRALVHAWRKRSLDAYHLYIITGVSDGLIPTTAIEYIRNQVRFTDIVIDILLKDK